MKKLFISQPMRDKTDEEIKVERVKAIKEVENHLGEKVQVIDSFFEGAPHEANPLWFLGKSIESLAQADIAYFCRGWQNYRGCRIENICAMEYGIEVLKQEPFKDTITEIDIKSYINGYISGVENTAKEFILELEREPIKDTEQKRIEEICKVAHIDDISDLSDGYHTFRELYYQRMMLFAAIVKQNRDKSWKSLCHEDGEYCFGGGWFIVGIDTPEGSYTYHYEIKYFDLFDCEILDCGKHWDGHTEKDVTRLLSLEQESILDKIRDEIEGKYRVILKGTPKDDWAVIWNECIDDVLKIIDKYKSESEDKE